MTGSVFRRIGAEGAIVLDTVDIMKAERGLAIGAFVQVRGRLAKDDGGGALWEVNDTETADEITTVALDNGYVATLCPMTAYDVRCVNIFSGTTGSAVGTRLLALVNFILANEGREIQFNQSISCGNVIFPTISQLRSILFRGRRGINITPSDPTSGTFMWDFAATPGASNSYPNFKDITIRGDPDTRPTCNGLRLGPSNYQLVDGFRGEYIAGTAFQAEAPFNSKFDATTIGCGTASLYAQCYAGSTAKNDPPNDIIICGATEQDFLGINIEHALLTRTGEPIKLHGGSDSITALRVFKSPNVKLQVDCSQDWDDPFILIVDGGNSLSEAEVVTYAAAANQHSVTLDVKAQANCRYTGTGTDAGWCLVDLGTNNSNVYVSGEVEPQTSPNNGGTFKYLKLQGGANSNATINVTGFVGDDGAFNGIAAADLVDNDGSATVIGLRQAHIADAETAHSAANTAALNALGTSINSILAVLEAHGLTETS